MNYLRQIHRQHPQNLNFPFGILRNEEWSTVEQLLIFSTWVLVAFFWKFRKKSYNIISANWTFFCKWLQCISKSQTHITGWNNLNKINAVIITVFIKTILKSKHCTKCTFKKTAGNVKFFLCDKRRMKKKWSLLLSMHLLRYSYFIC